MPRRQSYINADDRRLEVLQKPGHNDRHADQDADGACTQRQRLPRLGAGVQRRQIQHRHGKPKCDREVHQKGMQRHPECDPWQRHLT